jgi:hypothetical protein
VVNLGNQAARIQTVNRRGPVKCHQIANLA